MLRVYFSRLAVADGAPQTQPVSCCKGTEFPNFPMFTETNEIVEIFSKVFIPRWGNVHNKPTIPRNKSKDSNGSPREVIYESMSGESLDL